MLLFFDQSSYKMTEIVFSDDSGVYPQTKETDQPAMFSGHAIGYFLTFTGERGGTGFIVKVISPDSALVLTAAHVFCENFEFTPNQTDFILGGEAYQAQPVRGSIKWRNIDNALKDPITQNQVSFPDDWTLFLIEKKQGVHYSCKFSHLLLSNRTSAFKSGQKVYLVGFPKMFSKSEVSSIAPKADQSRYNEILTSLCSATKLIRSKGIIISDEELTAISCISAKGMSGSPLLVKEGGVYKVIGILHGGPASKIHNLVSKVFTSSSFTLISEASNLSEYLLEKACQYSDNSTRKGMEQIAMLFKTFSKLDYFMTEQLLIVYKCAYEIETGSLLKHNLVTPLRAFFSEISLILNSY